MRQVYETDDGRLFEDKKEAERHEEAIFSQWLTTTADGCFCTHVLGSLDNNNSDEFYGTDRDYALTFVKAAFALRHETEEVDEGAPSIRSEN
jgi:hypothetical protein